MMLLLDPRKTGIYKRKVNNRVIPDAIRPVGDASSRDSRTTEPGFKLNYRHAEAVSRQRRIINQEDANMPFEALGMDIERWIEHRFDLIDTAGCQIDSIFWDIGLSEDSYAVHHDSKLLPQLDHDGINKWRKQGIDWLKILINESHKRNLEAFWNHRICPIDIPQPFSSSCSHENDARENYLKKAHPEWINKCWWKQGLWNLANPELRKHKLRFLGELIESYDLDGFQVDFARHTPCLPPGKEWLNRECVTEFIRELRRMLLMMEAKKGKAILLAVRIAETIPGCHADGFEVEKWAEENLVDIFVLGGRTSEADIDAFKAITRGKNIKICPSFDGHHTNDGYYSPPIEYLRGVFSNWWAQGADSISVFNWTCAHEDKYDELGLSSMMKNPAQRQALFEIGSLQAMRGKTKMYAVERRGGYPWAGNYLYKNADKPLPCIINKAHSEPEFPLFIREKFSIRQYTAKLDIIFWKVPLQAISGIFINNTSLEITAVNEEHEDTEIYCDRPQPTCGFKAWSDLPAASGYKLLKISCKLNADLLVKGGNRIKIYLNTGNLYRQATVEKIELFIEKQ